MSKASKSTINKVNKLIAKTFPDIKEKWDSDDFQALLYKALKPAKVKREDNDKPKKHSPYITFCMAERGNMVQKYPNLKATEITEKLAQEWKRLKEEEPQLASELYGYNPPA